MTATHLELLVEEPSMEAFLRAFLPRLLPQDRTFEVHAFQGKNDLMGKLEHGCAAPRLAARRLARSSSWWIAAADAWA